MRSGLALTHFFAVLVATSTSLLLLAAAERRFDPLPTPPHAASALSSRCYALSFVSEDSAAAGWVPLRSPVCLTGTPTAREGSAGWFIAALPSPDPGRGHQESIAVLGEWRPVGVDSLDVRVRDWPVGIRLRVPATDSLGTGRLTASSDASFVISFRGNLYAINWPPAYRVRVSRLAIRTPAA